MSMELLRQIHAIRDMKAADDEGVTWFGRERQFAGCVGRSLTVRGACR